MAEKAGVLKDFGERLAAWIARKGHTETSFAAFVPVNASVLNRYVHGKRNISLVVLDRIVGRMGLTVSEFYAGAEAPEFEKRFSEDFLLFRNALHMADEEAMREIRKTLDRAIRESPERRKLRPNGSGAK